MAYLELNNGLTKDQLKFNNQLLREKLIVAEASLETANKKSDFFESLNAQLTISNIKGKEAQELMEKYYPLIALFNNLLEDSVQEKVAVLVKESEEKAKQLEIERQKIEEEMIHDKNFYEDKIQKMMEANERKILEIENQHKEKFDEMTKKTHPEETVEILDKRTNENIQPKSPEREVPSSETLANERNIAVCLHGQEKYSEALVIFEKVVESQKKMLGTEHSETLGTMGRIAACFYKLGELEKALEMLNQLVNSREKKLGPEHRATLTTKHNIACCFFTQGQYSEAKVMFENVLESRREVLREEHPDTITTMSWVAASLDKLGNWDEALELYDEVLYLREKVLGPEHLHTLKTKQSMACLLNKQGF